MNTFRHLTILLILTVARLSADGQNSYNLFKTYEPFKPDSTGSFYFAVDNVNFFKNNENKLNRSIDYTLTGTMLRPKVTYYPDAKLRLELGGHILKYNGRDDYAQLSPWFNAHYKASEKISIIIGNLDADQNHLLSEQLYNPELFYTATPEVGLQTKYISTRFSADLWIDWQKMILPGDPFKERFVFGAKTNLAVKESKESSLSLPFSFYGIHHGGTIGTAPGLATSFITLTPGLVYKKKIASKVFTDLELTSSFSLSTYPKDDVIFQQSSGWGSYLSGKLDSRYGGITAAYWHGHLFYTPQGTPIFQNYTPASNSWLTDHHLIDLKYHYQHQIIKDTFFGFMFDYYYDTIQKTAVNSEGLYLILNFGVIPKRTK
jgi:hypothetical protein